MQQVKTILVVDDDENWCYLSKKIIQRAGVANDIIMAYNGLEAFKKLENLRNNGEKLPDLIFLDIKMPVMDGFEFLEELAKSKSIDFTQTKIYMVSSSALAKDKERAEKYPIAGFITKPLTAQILADIVD